MVDRSTVSNLVSCDTALADMLNVGVAADLIMLDFSRAFYEVDMILCQKLLAFGLGSSLVSLFADFLSDINHFVTLGSSLSQVHFVPSGVVQELVVGPTLFNIFINDLPLKLSNVLLFFFADDVKALSKIQTVEDCELTLLDFNCIQEWLDVRKLPSCLPKSCVLHYGRSNTGYKYTIGNLPIPVVKELDDLGVLRTADFLWRTCR